MRGSGALIVFAREPRKGYVKTRLAATIGACEATAIYTSLLARTLRIAERSKFTARFVFAAQARETDYFIDRLEADRWTVRAQCAGDIGQRMNDAFDMLLPVHRFVVLIGSDVADFSLADLDRAFDSLDCAPNSAVVGPSVDGGYWLLGIGKDPTPLLTNMSWSTLNVAAITLERLANMGLQVITLTARHDIDLEEDLNYLA